MKSVSARCTRVTVRMSKCKLVSKSVVLCEGGRTVDGGQQDVDKSSHKDAGKRVRGTAPTFLSTVPSSLFYVTSSVALVPSSFFVTTSKAPVTSSVALVPSSLFYFDVFMLSFCFGQFPSTLPVWPKTLCTVRCTVPTRLGPN